MIRWGGAALVVLLLAAGVYWYINHQHDVRQEALRNAMQSFEAGIGQGGEFMKSFPTQEEKDKAVVKELTEVATKYSGKQEGVDCPIFSWSVLLGQRKLPEAEKQLKIAAAESAKMPTPHRRSCRWRRLYDVDRPAGRRRETPPVGR